MDLGRFGVDVQRRPDHDGVEVEGTGDRRGDEHHADRRALVGAGEIRLAVGVERRRSGAGVDSARAHLAVGRTTRGGELRCAGAVRGRRDARLRAVLDALQLRHHPGRQVDVDLADLLGAVGPRDVQLERAERARLPVFHARAVAGVELALGERLRAAAPAGIAGERR